jgi:hypothetical protein
VALVKVGQSTYRTCLPRQTSWYETTERLAGARCVKRRTNEKGEGLVASMLGYHSVTLQRPDIYSGLSLFFGLLELITTLLLFATQGLLLVHATHHIHLSNKN